MKKQILAFLTSFIAASAFAAEKVTIVAENDWYPYCAERGGQPEGLAVDIVRAAFKAADVEVTFKVFPYAKCMEDTKNGTEVGCFNSAWVPKYEADYIRTNEQLFDAEIAIFAAADSDKKDLKVSDLEGKTVGITNGYEYGAEFSENKKIKTDVANSDILGLKKQAAKRTDYFLIYSKVADYLLKENKDLQGKVKRVGTVTVDKLYLTFSKKHKDGKKFAALMDTGLKKIKADGTYKKIQDEWNAKLK